MKQENNRKERNEKGKKKEKKMRRTKDKIVMSSPEAGNPGALKKVVMSSPHMLSNKQKLVLDA